MQYGSLGAMRVRESFNPSQDSLVDKIKRHTADLIDLCNEGREKCDNNDKGETWRLWAMAMGSYEEAAMWAVKAATAHHAIPTAPK
jgi:hypothetical protein